MFPKIFCFLFGHKKFNSYEEVKNGELMTVKTPITYCTRCGKYIGEWWKSKKSRTFEDWD
jgi:hypothetical protein